MKIKSIQLCNFGCYKGTNPPIVFSTDAEKNVTVILGANKSGKTTLVQAFLWCLYEQVSPTNGVINSEAKAEMIALAPFDVFVEIVLIYSGKEYTIRRTQQFSKINGIVRNEKSSLRVQYKEPNGEQQSIPPRSCTETVNSILPKDLSDYFFYEGERFVDIKKRNVAAAVKGLMGLDAISTARDKLDPKRESSVTSKFRKGLKLENTQESDGLKLKLENSQEEREKIIERIERVKKDKEFYLRRKEEMEEQLSKNTLAKSLQAKRKDMENDIKIGRENISYTETQILSQFQQGALAFFALPLIDRALSAIDNSRQNGEGIPEMRQAAIDYILERKFCICGCDLEENEGARKRIHLERNLLPPEHLGTILHNHKQTLLGYIDFSKNYIEEVDANYKNWRKNIRFLDEKIEDLNKISEEISSNDLIGIEEIESEYQKSGEKLHELEKTYEKLIEDKGGAERDIENFRKKISSLVEKIDSNKKLQRYLSYSEALYEMLDESYSRREKEVRIDLNESVNRIFSEMYHGHRIVLIDDDYQIKLLATVGTTQEEIADTGGLKAVKNFAYITGLVDIAHKRVAHGNETDEEDVNETESYPLIMDAPFSATDAKHIENISRIIPRIAEQVIIIVMQKDWAYAESATKEKIGKSYIIENIDNSETKSKIREGE
jgi:DNA sulfur modification protein DndD